MEKSDYIIPTTLNFDPVKQEVVDPVSGNNGILTGYKGSDFLETGAVYYPHIPLYQTMGPNSYGFVITVESDGVHRYHYDNNTDGDIKALEDIEQKGLVVLDEDESQAWIDAIDPKRMADNIKNPPEYKLKAIWPPELSQDLHEYHSVKCEELLKNVIQKAVKNEKKRISRATSR